MMVEDDCSGLFDPAFRIYRLSRAALSVLGREWLLHGHMQDRVGMPLLMESCDLATMQAVAIDQWMAASPVYSQRVQRALGFGGSGVETIFKNLQLDIGMPHQFLDCSFDLHDSTRGEFRLVSCGALLDVEPLGDGFVHGMCHTIEDPTFDATAGATDPQARVRPVHRPPRVPAGREPHCHWTVDIADGPALRPHPNEAVVAASRAATIALPAPEAAVGAEPGGLADYGGPFDPGLQFEDLGHAALQVALNEVALQSHLLFRSYLLAVEQRFGAERARSLKPRVFAGLGGLTAQRLRVAMHLGGGAQGIARLLQIHPMLAPAGYVDTTCELYDDRRLRWTLRHCPVTEEPDARTWLAHLDQGPPSLAAFATLVQGADPRARVRPASLRDGERLAYEVVVEPDTEPATDPPEVRLAKFSTGAAFLFRRRRPVRTLSSPVAAGPGDAGARRGPAPGRG